MRHARTVCLGVLSFLAVMGIGSTQTTYSSTTSLVAGFTPSRNWPKWKIQQRWPLGGFAVRAFRSQPLIRPFNITPDNWLGGPGNWNAGALWSTGAMPGSSNDVFINNSTPAAVVQLNVADTINNLTVGSTSVLNFNDFTSLTVGGTTISNAGTIGLSSLGDPTTLIIGASNVTLTGGGTVTMSNSTENIITGSAATNTITNQETIQGSGNIGNNSMALVNSGTINANQSAALTVQPSNGLTNSGTLEATGGGTLILEVGSGAATNTGTIQATSGSTLQVNGGTYTNTGGTIKGNAGTLVFEGGAVINGGAVSQTGAGSMQLGGATINAPVTNSATGIIEVTSTGTNNTIGVLTNPAGGQVKIDDFGFLTLTGSANSNAGTIALNSLGDQTELIVGASNVTLSGGGTVTMGNASTNIITGAAATDTLTNQETIRGSGNIGNGSMGFINAGTVLANQSTPLIIDPSSTGFTNNGTLQVNKGDTLEITGGPFSNYTGATMKGGRYYVSGTLQFGASGSSLTTNDANLTLAGTGAKLLDLGGNNLLHGFKANGGIFTVAAGGSFTTAASLTNTGTVDLEQASSLKVSTGLINSGTVATNKTNLQGGANHLTVLGKVTNNTGGTVTIGSNNNTSDAATFGSLANSGTITVDTGASLTLSTATTDTNAGTIAVNGTLDIKSATTLSGTGAITLTSGAITGLGAGPAFTNSSTIQGSGTISNLGITNAGTLFANQAAPLVILPTAAGLNNTGTLEVAAGDTMQIGTSAGGALTNFSGTTLTGGAYNVSGTLQFGASGTTIATNAANITLNGAGKMIDFGNNNILAGFNNNAAAGVFKLGAGASLTTTGGSFTNAGLFTVSTGTTFTVGGSSFNFTQTGGTATVNGSLTSTTLGTLAVNGGSLDGVGTLGYNVVDAGILTPGDSAAVTGKLTVADTYTQNSTGALDIQINGATVGTKYDQLKVTQGATLGGTLNIALGAGFTPTMGETFTILTASSLGNTKFTTVNGLGINGTEHFTITYNAGSVVLTVMSGALPASSPNLVETRWIHPPLHHRSVSKGHNGFVAYGRTIAQLPAIVPANVSAVSIPRVPALGMARTSLPVSLPVSFGHPATGMLGFRPMDQFGSPVAAAAPAGTGDASVAGSLGIAPVSAAAYNSMSGMNHMRFECGVDLKALLKTSRKRLLKGLWAAPDSPDALAIGYMTYNAAH